MDLGRGLITALVDEDKLNEVLRSGITEEFLDEEHASVLTYVQRHYTDYRKVPSRSAVKSIFPDYQFSKVPEPLQFYIDQIKEAWRRTKLEDGLLDVTRSYARDTKEAEQQLRDLLSSIAVTQKSFRDLELAKCTEDRITAYEKREENPGPDGILTNWETIDNTTLGWHPEELIVLVGERYQMKSWILLWAARQAMKQGERVLFATKEMSSLALARRFDAIYSNVKFDRLRRGELLDDEKARFQTRLRELGTVPGEGSIVFARHGVNTIADIEYKAVETDATMVVVDSVYLFDPGAGRQNFGSETARRMAISQGCKALAERLGIPMMVSTQAGRKKPGKPAADLDNIEWSNAFSQDADCVLMITKDDIDKDLNRLKMNVLKTRDGDTTSMFVKTDFEYMTFEEDETPTEPTTDIDLDDEVEMDLG